MLVSCNKDDDNNNSNGPDFLKIGSEWMYDLSITTQDITQAGDFSYKVLTQEEDWKYSVKQITQLQGFPAETEIDYWTDDNVFNLGRDMNSVGVGDSWSEPNNGVDYYTTILADNVEVTVPAGTFNCRKLRQTQSDDTSRVGYHYYNDNYGVVLTELSYKIVEQGVDYNVEQVMKLRSTNF
jgi:hypothetical protein